MQKKIRIFVSHSSKDQAVASELVDFLEKNNCQCWIAPRDIQPGLSYADCITKGIESSRAMVFVSSEQSNSSKDCAAELEQATKQQLLIIPFRIDESVYANATRSFFSPAQEITVLNNKPAEHFPALLNVLKTYGRKPVPSSLAVEAGFMDDKEALCSGKSARFFVAVGLVLATIFIGYAFLATRNPGILQQEVTQGKNDFRSFYAEIKGRLEREPATSILIDLLRRANRNLPSVKVNEFKIMKDRDKPRMVVGLRYEIDYESFSLNYIPAITMIAERMALKKSDVDTALAGNDIGMKWQYIFQSGFPSGFAGGLNSSEVLAIETWRNDARDNFLMRRFILPEDTWREIEALTSMKFFIQISFWDAEDQLIRREEFRPDCKILNPLKSYRRIFIFNSLPGSLYSNYMETLPGEYSLPFERPPEELHKVHQVTAAVIPVD